VQDRVPKPPTQGVMGSPSLDSAPASLPASP